MMTDNRSFPEDAALETVIIPRTRDLGNGFQVRRALPAAQRQMVGPFIFFDQMGPVLLRAGNGLDVRPHPHIGLATVTYLFAGEILHRDSLGSVQSIRPGEVNWMTAGRGIVHSERTPTVLRRSPSDIFGIQTWIALPRRDEEIEPSFIHCASEALPVLEEDDKVIRLIVGSLYGERAPIPVRSEMFYADATLSPNSTLWLTTEHEERAAYVVSGALRVDGYGEAFEPGALLVFRADHAVRLQAGGAASTRVMLLGGAPMDGPRFIWWNFVSSSRERIEQAKVDWKAGRFSAVPGETEFIPLPEEEASTSVRYP